MRPGITRTGNKCSAGCWNHGRQWLHTLLTVGDFHKI